MSRSYRLRKRKNNKSPPEMAGMSLQSTRTGQSQETNEGQGNYSTGGRVTPAAPAERLQIMRDRAKAIAEGRKLLQEHPAFDLEIEDMRRLLQTFAEDQYEGLVSAVAFGVAIGSRIQKKEGARA